MSYTIRGPVTIYATTCVAVVWVGNSWYQLVNAAVFALAWGHIALPGHDIGHHATGAPLRAGSAAKPAVVMLRRPACT